MGYVFHSWTSPDRLKKNLNPAKYLLSKQGKIIVHSMNHAEDRSRVSNGGKNSYPGAYSNKLLKLNNYCLMYIGVN